MIQGGGYDRQYEKQPTNDPIPLEADRGLDNDKGTIAMARTGDPDSATSQFFINTVDNGSLDPGMGRDGYCAFGTVVEGMDVVERIEGVATGSRNGMDDVPKATVVIERIRRVVRTQVPSALPTRSFPPTRAPITRAERQSRAAGDDGDDGDDELGLASLGDTSSPAFIALLVVLVVVLGALGYLAYTALQLKRQAPRKQAAPPAAAKKVSFGVCLSLAAENLPHDRAPRLVALQGSRAPASLWHSTTSHTLRTTSHKPLNRTRSNHGRQRGRPVPRPRAGP